MNPVAEKMKKQMKLQTTESLKKLVVEARENDELSLAWNFGLDELEERLSSKEYQEFEDSL